MRRYSFVGCSLTVVLMFQYHRSQICRGLYTVCVGIVIFFLANTELVAQTRAIQKKTKSEGSKIVEELFSATSPILQSYKSRISLLDSKRASFRGKEEALVQEQEALKNSVRAATQKLSEYKSSAYIDNFISPILLQSLADFSLEQLDTAKIYKEQAAPIESDRYIGGVDGSTSAAMSEIIGGQSAQIELVRAIFAESIADIQELSSQMKVAASNPSARVLRLGYAQYLAGVEKQLLNQQRVFKKIGLLLNGYDLDGEEETIRLSCNGSRYQIDSFYEELDTLSEQVFVRENYQAWEAWYQSSPLKTTYEGDTRTSRLSQVENWRGCLQSKNTERAALIEAIESAVQSGNVSQAVKLDDERIILDGDISLIRAQRDALVFRRSAVSSLRRAAQIQGQSTVSLVDSDAWESTILAYIENTITLSDINSFLFESGNSLVEEALLDIETLRGINGIEREAKLREVAARFELIAQAGLGPIRDYLVLLRGNLDLLGGALSNSSLASAGLLNAYEDTARAEADYWENRLNQLDVVIAGSARSITDTEAELRDAQGAELALQKRADLYKAARAQYERKVKILIDGFEVEKYRSIYQRLSDELLKSAQQLKGYSTTKSLLTPVIKKLINRTVARTRFVARAATKNKSAKQQKRERALANKILNTLEKKKLQMLQDVDGSIERATAPQIEGGIKAALQFAEQKLVELQ